MTPWMVGLGLLVSFTADAGTENAIGASRLGVIDAETVPPLPPGTLLIGSALHHREDVRTGLEHRLGRLVTEAAPWCSATSPAASPAC